MVRKSRIPAFIHAPVRLVLAQFSTVSFVFDSLIYNTVPMRSKSNHTSYSVLHTSKLRHARCCACEHAKLLTHGRFRPVLAHISTLRSGTFAWCISKLGMTKLTVAEHTHAASQGAYNSRHVARPLVFVAGCLLGCLLHSFVRISFLLYHQLNLAAGQGKVCASAACSCLLNASKVRGQTADTWDSHHMRGSDVVRCGSGALHTHSNKQCLTEKPRRPAGKLHTKVERCNTAQLENGQGYVRTT